MKREIEKYLKYLKIEKNASGHTIISYENDLTQFAAFLESQSEEKKLLYLRILID